MLQEQQAKRKQDQDTIRDAETIVAGDGDTCTAADVNRDGDDRSLVVGRNDEDTAETS